MPSVMEGRIATPRPRSVARFEARDPELSELFWIVTRDGVDVLLAALCQNGEMSLNRSAFATKASTDEAVVQ